MVEPTLRYVAPSVEVSTSVDSNARFGVEAATVVTQGPAWLAVPHPGPALPADALTVMFAANASRKASSTGSL